MVMLVSAGTIGLAAALARMLRVRTPVTTLRSSSAVAVAMAVEAAEAVDRSAPPFDIRTTSKRLLGSRASRVSRNCRKNSVCGAVSSAISTVSPPACAPPPSNAAPTEATPTPTRNARRSVLR